MYAVSLVVLSCYCDCVKSPDVDHHFSDFLSFLERTANGDVVFTLKMGCPIEKFRVNLIIF